MRKIYDFQSSLDRIPLEEIDLYPDSHDDTVAYLAGFRAILLDVETREALFALLRTFFPLEPRTNRGRPGMDWLVILLLAGFKQATHCDYDRLALWANDLTVLRQMMGHGAGDRTPYRRSTLHENVSALPAELLVKVNQLVVKLGHRMMGHQEGETLKCRCDSKPVKTHVHFPTDLSLLWDSIRCLIRIRARVAKAFDLPGWRQVCSTRSTVSFSPPEKVASAATNSRRWTGIGRTVSGWWRNLSPFWMR